MIKAHGGKLIDRVTKRSQDEIARIIPKLNQLQIADRFVSDALLIGTGALSPLKGFMGSQDVRHVMEIMHLSNGLLWTIPIILPVDPDNYKRISIGEKLLLVNSKLVNVAILTVSEKYELDLDEYCKKIYLTNDDNHPGVAVVKSNSNKFLAGDIELLSENLEHPELQDNYLSPKQMRNKINELGWKSVVAFQTRNPIHRAHEYILKSAQENNDGLLIHPVVGETKPDDIPYNVRMQCYQVLVDKYFNKKHTMLSVLPWAMRYAGPREAIAHMILRQNYGCTHMIIGRDHAGVGTYYGTYDAQKLVAVVANELRIKAIFFEDAFFCKGCNNVVTTKTCPHKEADHVKLSGTAVRKMLSQGERPPLEFTRKEIADILIANAKK